MSGNYDHETMLRITRAEEEADLRYSMEKKFNASIELLAEHPYIQELTERIEVLEAEKILLKDQLDALMADLNQFKSDESKVLFHITQRLEEVYQSDQKTGQILKQIMEGK